MPASTRTASSFPDFPDFNDAAKLGSGKEMVDRLTNLIAIFENPALKQAMMRELLIGRIRLRVDERKPTA